MMTKFKNKQPILNLVFIVMCIIFIIPFILLLSISFSNEIDIAKYGYSIIPRHFDLTAYRYLFAKPKQIINGYKVTIAFSVLGTAYSLFTTSMLGYALSQKALPGRKVITFLLFFTMLFGGGLVPTYILISQYLHLSNNLLVYILPGAVGAYNAFMMRTFFNDLPDGIIESALIDGANDYTIYFKFVLPLSKPILATLGIMRFLGLWNDWGTSMLYITDDNLISLQYLLQRIMRNIELLNKSEYASQMLGDIIPSETVRMAMAVVVAGPALVVFPFFQKYFVKGITVGSIKG